MSRQLEKTEKPALGPATGRLSGRDRRRQLIQTASRLFSRKGFGGTTTKEIAQAAGVTEAMIFRHFATKEDLYAAILDSKAGEANVAEWLVELGQYAARKDDERLFSSFAAGVLQHHRRDREFFRLMLYSGLESHELAQNFREKQVRPLHEFLRRYIIRRQRDGDFRPRDAHAAVRALMGMLIYHIMVTELFPADWVKLSDKEAVKHFTALLLDGLRNPSPPKRRTKKAASVTRRG
jgi:TetR/AcrR family transcriptional regulator